MLILDLINLHLDTKTTIPRQISSYLFLSFSNEIAAIVDLAWLAALDRVATKFFAQLYIWYKVRFKFSSSSVELRLKQLKRWSNSKRQEMQQAQCRARILCIVWGGSNVSLFLWRPGRSNRCGLQFHIHEGNVCHEVRGKEFTPFILTFDLVTTKTLKNNMAAPSIITKAPKNWTKNV